MDQQPRLPFDADNAMPCMPKQVVYFTVIFGLQWLMGPVNDKVTSPACICLAGLPSAVASDAPSKPQMIDFALLNS